MAVVLPPVVSWQSFSPDCGKMLIPGRLGISTEIPRRKLNLALGLMFPTVTPPVVRSPAHQLFIFLLFFPWFYWRWFLWDFCLLLSVTHLHLGLHQEKALLSSISVKVPGGIFEVFTVQLWPETGRIKCETRNLRTSVSALGESLCNRRATNWGQEDETFYLLLSESPLSEEIVPPICMSVELLL